MKWFRHMTDASEDEFVVELESLFGLEGYARWFKLLEVIARQMDQSSKCSVAYPWSKWQTFLKGKRKKLETFLEHSQNKQKIFLKQNGNILEISCPKLLKLRDEYSRKSGHTPDTCPDIVAPEVEVEVEVHKDNYPALYQQFQEQLDETCKSLVKTNIFPEAWACKQHWVNKSMHPAAILQALTQCAVTKPAKPWGFVRKIVKTESGNYFANDHERETKEKYGDEEN